MSVIIGDIIVCAICGIKFRRITNTHLAREHSMTIKEYQILYPTFRIMSEEAERLQSTRIANYAKTEEGRKIRAEVGKNNLGKKRSEEFKLLRSEKYSGSGNPFYNKTHSEKTKKSLSIHFQGVSEDEWEGFSSKGKWKSRRARRWSKDVFARDNFTCALCSRRGGDLEAHHIVPRREAPELSYDNNNGITLCVPCHRKTFKKEGQYREGFEKMIAALSSSNREVL